ncbi:prolipoprotein diacylglyceryl transferase [Acinetobacter apis]|uniref:FimV domain-containing protein n=1 Tax=Acinetobacter apis TaxID=1229165 RepID=A0A217EGF5_9GAMM|nr:hypothetical protein [Acinetobacter apis]SNQ29427.1 hypothetical protein SAMN05444584_1379 [Acinetobacter apis]
MLTYILPLVLLLLIAIVVVMKKRGNTQKPQKGKAKEASSSAAKAEETQAVEKQQKEDAAIQKENEKQFQTIQSLMAQEQFYDAEALINQSLNRDHKQGHLYSLLLEIYQKQDNQLAINQILNDLRTLQMFDTLREIENKIAAKKAAEEKEAQQKAVQAAKEKQQAEKEQAERKRAQKAAEPAPVVAPVVEQTAPAESKPDTEKSVEETSASEKQAVQEKTTEQERSSNFEPLEFPSSSNTTTASELESHSSSEKQAEKEAPAAQQHDQEHVLEFEFDAPKAETKPQAQPAPVAAEPKKDEQDAHFIDFDFGGQSQSEKKDAEVEQPVKTETTSHGQSFELQFDQPAEAAPTASVTPPAENEKADESPAITPAETDHLFLAFPELSEVSENALNIKLAKQYIDMGEFARASDLLTDPHQSFTAEEQTEVDQLLNKIAS